MNFAGKMQSSRYATILRKVKFMCVKLEVFTAVTMKNDVFWHVTPCGSSRYNVSSN
jgi:hypothetical protein